MKKLNINTSKKVIPQCYAYTTPQVREHDGWTKIGFTEQDVDTRIRQQTQTANLKYIKEWVELAMFADGKVFHDTDFHAYLQKDGIERDIYVYTDQDGNEKREQTEWFHILPNESHTRFIEFRTTRGIFESFGVVQYSLRDEQSKAVGYANSYFKANVESEPEYLWNCKPRFGKTLSTYDLCKTLKAQKVLIVTNRPSIANSWYEDYVKFMGTESGYYFVSQVEDLKNQKYVLSREQYTTHLSEPNHKGCIEFVSLQDLKGSVYFGGKYKKLGEVADLEWDLLVIDEAHEGVDTYKTDIAFDQIKRKYTLHLSGTPFKALANNKFDEHAIFNWTYADEQKAKREWYNTHTDENPYESLPQLNLYTYQMSEIVLAKAKAGADFNDDGQNEEYAFDLNEFFSTNSDGVFKHEEAVDKFLDALVTQTRFPFSTPELRNELKHTFWLLNRVDSAKALAKKLKDHPVFGNGNYEIVLAAGNGKIDDDDENRKSLDKVKAAIAQHDKTITLSVGQLTTGITVPEWTAVLMLSNVESPALYMQAAFRAQNPCLFKSGKDFYRKENAYVFDFDPARTLTIVEKFANDLAVGGDTATRKKRVYELLNFFPVYGEDEDGEMITLDAEKVLSIPRKIHSREVVRRGFMSNFLFQNIHNIFNAPTEVIDIITKFDPQKEPVPVTPDTKDKLNIDDGGDVNIPEEQIIGTATDVFGAKIYGIQQDLMDVIDDINDGKTKEDDELIKIKQALNYAAEQMIDTAKENYGKDLTKSAQQAIGKEIATNADNLVNKAWGQYQIQKNTNEIERKEEIQQAIDNNNASEKTIAKINAKYDAKNEKLHQTFTDTIKDSLDTITKSAGETIVKKVETDKKQKEKNEIEGTVRDHLRGFSRTIPSFLMAYGDENTTLENFDQIIPDEVFQDVTSISLDQFRFLRDGGDYTDSETGETKHFEGHLFDPIVFNDSVKEFLDMKAKLANYFDEPSKEDIFDYIPPQQTNQIFTPKKVVKEMVDYLEQENPGCFDDPDKTFIDLYMKSGLYITEIVKRLYQSKKMKKLFPDDKARLKHIFEKQVYGLAPTEIIYKIATAYILGFDSDITIKKHNFRQYDALPAAQSGTLEKELDKVFEK